MITLESTCLNWVILRKIPYAEYANNLMRLPLDCERLKAKRGLYGAYQPEEVVDIGQKLLSLVESLKADPSS